MLERDMEHLLAEHIEEFLPGRKLNLVGRQVNIAGYRMDILFEEGTGVQLIMEIKRGLVTRQTVGQMVGQIGQYYGLVKQAYPLKEVRLLLVANVIPPEFRTYLRDMAGVEAIEIPQATFIAIAGKYGYTFTDCETRERKDCAKREMACIAVQVSTGRRVWIFQANPNRYDILNALDDEQITEDVWMVNQHKDEIKKSDVGLVWMSGKEAGIYEVIDILSDPEFLVESPVSASYWTDEDDKLQARLRIRYTHRIKLHHNPVYKNELRSIPGLAGMQILHCARGTNFPVTNEEWRIITHLIEKRYE
jgi:hypothetical protein